MATKRNRSLARLLRPRNRYAALKKKMKLLESKEVRWVVGHLKTKAELKPENSVDGAPVDDAPVTAFGEIEFKGATRRARSKVSLTSFYCVLFQQQMIMRKKG